MFSNPLDGMDPLRAFIMEGIIRDEARKLHLQQMKAPHAYAEPAPRRHFDREKIEELRRPKKLPKPKQKPTDRQLIEGPSLIGSAPHGRLFKGHRP